MSFDDLYNNFKIVEQEVKGTASSSSSSSSQNVAFVSSSNSTNEVNTAYGVSTANTQVSPASTQVSTASTQVSTANLCDDTVYALLASQPNGSQLVHEDLKQIHEDDLEEMDLKWQLALLSMRTRRFFQKTRRKITINGSDTAGYDKSKVECFNCHKSVNVEETSSKSMLAIDEAGFDWSYMTDDEVPTNMALMAFSDSKIPDKSRKGLGFVSYNAVPPPPIGLFSPPNLDLSYSGLEEFQQPEFEGYGHKPSKSVSEDTSNKVKESPDAPLVEELVSNDNLEKKTVFPTVAKMEFVIPKQQEIPVRKRVKYAEMYRERVVSGNNYIRVNYNYSAKKTHPSAQRNMVLRVVLLGLVTDISKMDKNKGKRTKPKHKIRRVQEIEAEGIFNFNGPTPVVNAVRAKLVNVVKASACWVWRLTKLNSASITLKRHNYVDARGRSKNLMEDMLPLGEEPNKEKLLVKELLKLMCDKKNSVLFTNTGCFHLSPDFKLADESQGLGHVIFKMSNKLVKENLVRGLPSKRFENGQLVLLVLRESNTKASCAGPKWLFDIDVLTKSMSYVPVVAGTNSNDFTGTEESIGAGHSSKETGSSQNNDVSQKDDGIFISQDKYVDEILKKFGFSTMKTTSTPMETSKPLLKDAEVEDVDVHLNSSMIGSLMYLIASRPDIMFDVCACARFQVSHLHAVKSIF
ncbi:hypothetical protein Tco_0727519 [Tanacetum coccineum]|uniref:Uncharacterized protein n=1 Tax=Tanacetum coccineum TaxID=301880 RepID=A0ABQ4YIK9_9ASTR